MAKLIELQEAAKMLGVTPEELTEMRSRNEIFGYRDGSSWKFKEQEIERIAQQRGISLDASNDDLSLDSGSQDSLELELDGLDADSDAESDSILVSENELGQSDDSTSSTIIGKPDADGSDLDSQVDLGDLQSDGSELRLAGSSDAMSTTSDVLESEDKEPGPSDTANLLGESDELKLEGDSGSFDLNLDGESEISLDLGSEVDLSASKASSSGFGSAIDLDLDDDDLVLGSSSDVTGAGDSGINLTNPADSGLSLEEPLDLDAGSGVDSLELGEDDMIVLDDEAEAEAPTDLQADNDFLLTPIEESDDESSGSQVIDLDSAEFDESAATILADNASPMDEAVTFDSLDEDGADFLEVDSAGGDAVGAGAALPAAASATKQEASPYTALDVSMLLGSVIVLGLTGMMMLDLINNIWSWDQDYPFKSPVMDTILSIMGRSK